MSLTARPAAPLLSATEERTYLIGRSEVHRQLAENTTEIEIRAIHLRMSRLYAEQAALIVMVLSD
ncbi:MULTISPECIES: hypothetical protein [unclassified Sphingomonas]|jgi:hypothetical protein|uniref:hypothetical protein n=1 Tax=unclassified Sphingomonas TaxID=196159 RepID=UPI0006FA72D6|nr:MULTISPECIES: hypothetical protein [unclassified Sphingomonas]KQM23875.1 hypothetical protein ASE58_16395 [Sphingomonas sp. Leaf9]KQM42003.1 hypothetical protein ASE57_16400 [Sphingomonas sp. Leaf11]KQM81834.1 hypothetical protein ASE67_16665 [Sphingomonas sp. Leaf23]